MPVSAPLADLLQPATLHRLGNLALIARIAVNGFLSGLHRSLSLGQGGEFLQYRSYYPGDDLKYVDWKVFGKRDRFYTKVYREETNMDLILVVDASGSMDYTGTRAPCSKWRYASMVAACLAYLATRQGDNVGLYLYNEGFTQGISPGNRGGQLERILAALQRQQPTGEAHHERVWKSLTARLRSRGVIVFLSDFLEAEESVPPLLKTLPATRHESIALQVLDPDEIDFPFALSTEFVGTERGDRIRTFPEYVRDDYQRQMNQFLADLSESFRNSPTDFLRLTSDTSLALSLATYLHRRDRLH